MATMPTPAFSGSAPQATGSMPMSQVDASRAASGYTGTIPPKLTPIAAAPAAPTLPAQASPTATASVAGQRPAAPARPTLPPQANQRAVAAVNKQTQPRLTAPQPVAQPPVNVQQVSPQQPSGMPVQMPQLSQGLIGRPMVTGAPNVPMPAQYPLA